MYHILHTGSFQTLAAWPPMNQCTCAPARQRQHLHVPYQICYHFLKIPKSTDGATRVKTPPNPPVRTHPRLYMYITVGHQAVVTEFSI